MQVFIVRILVVALSISVAFGIHCYDCNSKFDPQCGDPFKNFTLGTVDCDTKVHNLNITSTFCRKIKQKVNEEIRVIRSCGFISDTDEESKCRKSNPSKGVEILSCECKGGMCNGSRQINANFYSLNVAAMIIYTVSRRIFM